MTYPHGPGDYPPPAEREPSPWSSPIVVVAIAAGVLIVVGGVLAALLLIPRAQEETPQAGTSATPSPETLTETVSPTETTQAPPESTSTTTTSPTTQPSPPNVPGTDQQGFTAGPRCNAAEDPAVAIGETARSRVVICQVGDQDGRWYYKGAADGGDIEVQYPRRIGSAFHAENDGTTYILSAQSLRIVQNGATVATEPMLAYWELDFGER